ncbi:PaaI family thioesterase [Pelagimonas sp. KU-00592-HH]|uniref:PaaI family thioesterase n=1 Tax=Roseobacteraceae TaxID=2854170 RepID=UPI0020CFA459|nr:PaaI family thioesterase [Shimia sp. CNT1-13L.2]MCP9482049.1 PaaI family thioesterase [Shimia sp. CNT1-13L.2]
MGVKFTVEEMNSYLAEVFPQVQDDFRVEELTETGCVMRLMVQDRHLRPGGTVSGPSMFGLADVAAYVATMGMVGKEALAVTTGCSMDFMRKPAAGVDLIARASLLKLGKTLSVTDILIYSEGMDQPVARSTMTYSIPPAGKGAL